MNQIFEFLYSIRLFQFIGISPFSIGKNFRPSESRQMKFYSLFQIGLAVLALVGSFYDRNLYLNGVKRNIANTVDFLQLVGIRLAHLIIVCEAFYQRKTLKYFFAHLCDLDLMMKQVNINVNFRKNQVKSSLKLLAEVVFYLGLPLIAISIVVIRQRFEMIFYGPSYLLPFLVCCFRYLQVSNCVWFIKKRFDLLNERLAEIELNNENIKVKLKNISSIDFKIYLREIKKYKSSKPLKYFEQLILMRQMYDKLYNLSLMVNYSFGLSNLVNTTNDFFSLTSNSYFIFMSFQNSPLLPDHIFHIVQTFFWGLPHLVNVVTLSAVCHFTVHSVSNSEFVKENEFSFSFFSRLEQP